MEPTINSTLAEQYAALWKSAKTPTDVYKFLDEHRHATVQQRSEVLLVDQSQQWDTGQKPLVEEYCQNCPDVGGDPQFKQQLIIGEYSSRLRRGEQINFASFLSRFPEIEPEKLKNQLAARGISSESRGSPEGGLAATDDSRRETEETADRPPEDTATFGLGEIGIQDPEATQSVDQGTQRPALAPSDFPVIEGYEVLEYIAKGGMGFVLKARHKVLDRLVAIKMPLARYVEDDNARIRFLREARAAAGLQHPQICPIFEVGQAGKHPFIIMGYVEGRTLTRWAKTQQPTAREAAEMLARVAHAVDYAHKNDVLHRDIKPDNIMVQASDNRPVLMDFGLAKELTDESSQLTQDGQVMGTPAYMAPEQAAGQIDRIGPATDVYALGAVLYYLLCGQTPFEGNVGEVLHKVQAEEPVPPGKLANRIHRDLETICLKAMAKDPAARYASATDLAEDLERFNAGEAILARREGLSRKLIRIVRRRPLVSTIVLVAALLFSVGGSFAWLANQDRVESIRDRQIAKLLSQINSGLAEQQWNQEHLQKMEALVSELAAASSDQAADTKRRVTDRFIASIDDSINYPRLDQTRIDAIDQSLELLESREPMQTQQLQQRLSLRLARWNDQFELKAPFDNLREVSQDGRIRVSGQALSVLSPTDPLPLMRTQISSEGRVELDATFDSSWQRESRIGVTLNTGNGIGYALELRLPQEKELPKDGKSVLKAIPKSFQAVRAQSLPLIAELLRNGVSIQRWDLNPQDLPDGPLQLRLRREAGKLTLWVNEQSPLEFEDLFPLSPTQAGSFGLLWPREVGLLKLRAARRFVGVDASELEVADDLYAREQFSEALAAYRQLAAAAADDNLRREAEFKSALCLLESSAKGSGEAEEIFSDLMTQSDRRWSPLAACQLWLLKLRQRDVVAADLILEFLSSDSSFANLGALLPRDVRDQIINSYRDEGMSAVGLLQANPDRVSHAKQFVAIQSLLNSNGRGGTHAEMIYVIALRLAGRRKEALEVAKEFAEQSQNFSCLCKYSEILCLDNRAEFALEEYDRVVNSYRAQGVNSLSSVSKDRAEILAALSRWSEVKKALEDAAEMHGHDPDGFMGTAVISLMYGFALEHLGNADKAKQHWRDACQEIRIRRKTHPLGETYEAGPDFLILAAMAEDFRSEDFNNFIAQMGSTPLVSTALRMVNQERIASIYQQAWNTPRGKQLAEMAAFDLTTYKEGIRHPVALGVYGLFLFDALGGQASAEQEQFLWDTAVLLVDDMLDGQRINSVQGMLLGATWKYQTGVLGWATVATQLEPELRGPISYIAGHRYLSKDREQTLQFWETAAKDAAADSTLARLVGKDIALLNAGQGLLRIENHHDSPLQVTVKQGQETVATVDVTDFASVDLASGDYTLALGETTARVQLSQTSVTISSPRRVQVEINISPDRKVARWAIGLGGSVDLKEVGKAQKRVTDAADLPTEPFQLQAVNVGSISKVNDGDLLRFQPLESLESLQIWSTGVTDDGIRQLAGHEQLRHLELTGLEISNASLETLTKFKLLTRLNIANTNINYVGIEQLASLENLVQLGLDGKQLTARSAAAFTSFPKLQQLTLMGPQINDTSLGRLTELSRLRVLRLSMGPQVTGEGLGKLTSLREFYFNYHGVIDETTLDGIGDREGLKLSFVSTALRPGTVERLKSMASLKILTLNNTNVTQAEADALKQALPDCKVTWEVNDLAFIPDRSQAEWLLSSGNRVTVSVIDGDNIAINSIEELPKEHFRVVGVAIINKTSIRPWEFSNLKKLWYLRFLDVSGTTIDDAGMRELAELPALVQLNFQKTAVTPEGLRPLASAKMLWTLAPPPRLLLDKVSGVSGAEVLAEMSQLKSIAIEGSETKDACLQSLAVLPQLTSLTLAHDVEITRQGMESLRSIQSLVLNQIPSLQDNILAGLSHLPNLRLSITSTPLQPEDLADLRTLKNLKQLVLTKTNLTRQQAEELEKALSGCQVQWQEDFP